MVFNFKTINFELNILNMKSLITAIFFAAPFIIHAQEPAKTTKTTTPPPSSEKSITEKGVSSTKGRGVTLKKAEATGTVSPAAVKSVEPTPTEEVKAKPETSTPK